MEGESGGDGVEVLAEEASKPTHRFGGVLLGLSGPFEQEGSAAVADQIGAGSGEGPDGADAVHVVDGPVPGDARLLDAAAFEVHLGARDQVQGDDPRVRIGRAVAASVYLSAAARWSPMASWILAVREYTDAAGGPLTGAQNGTSSPGAPVSRARACSTAARAARCLPLLASVWA